MTVEEASAHTRDGWVQPNVTRSEARAMGLFIAEIGADFVAYGRTEEEALANLTADVRSAVIVTGPSGGAS